MRAAELAEEEVSGVAGLVGGLGELGAAFAYLERVDGELLQVVVEGEFEAVGEGRLNQEPHLLRAGPALDVGNAVEVEVIGGEPGRCVDELFGVEAVGEGDEIVQVGVDRHDVAAANGEAFALLVGLAWLDCDDVELGYGIGGHCLGRRRDGPGVFGGDVLEVEGVGLAVLGRASGDGVAVRVQCSGVGHVDRLDLKVDVWFLEARSR